MKDRVKLGLPLGRLLLCLFLASLFGCDPSGQGVIDADRAAGAARKSAEDALTAEGAVVTSESLPGFNVQLSVVDLRRVKEITDKTLALLEQMNSHGMRPVAKIDLSDTNVTDEQLGRLSEKLVGLMKLSLRNTAISDAGLQRIAGLTSLNDLDLTNTKVTAGGVDAFLKSRADNPDVKAKKPKIKR